MELLIIVGLLMFAGVVGFGIWSFATINSTTKTICTVAAVICGIALIAVVLFGINGTESGKRWKKDLTSEFSGGLHRTITCYNQYGDVLRTYEGQMDIEKSDGDKIVFVMDGVKYMIYKGSFDTVIVEEHPQGAR